MDPLWVHFVIEPEMRFTVQQLARRIPSGCSCRLLDHKSDIWILSNKSQGQKMQGDGGFALHESGNQSNLFRMDLTMCQLVTNDGLFGDIFRFTLIRFRRV